MPAYWCVGSKARSEQSFASHEQQRSSAVGTTVTTRKRHFPIVYRVLQVAVVTAVVGFWFHTSNMDATILGKYSREYFLLALAATLGLLVGGLWYLWFLFTPQQIKLRRGTVNVSFVGKMLVTGVVLVAAAIPAESVLRGIHAREQGRMEASFHPYLQATPKPNDTALTINRWGFRGEDIEVQKPPGRFRVFVLGGSTVYCSRVGFEDTHCRILEKKLRQQYPRVSIEVQNAGMHWHTSQHSLIKFQTKIQDFDPDLIVVFHAINDLARSFCPPHYARTPFQADYGHYDGPIARMVGGHRADDPIINSLALSTVQNFFGRYCYSDFRQENRPVPTRSVDVWKSQEPFRRNMTNLARSVLAQDIRLVMASQASLYDSEMGALERSQLTMSDTICRDVDFRPDIDSLAKGMDTFNAVSRDVAMQFGVPFVDLAATVPKTLDYFLDDVHYTKLGNQLVGETLAQAIISANYVAVPEGRLEVGKRLATSDDRRLQQ